MQKIIKVECSYNPYIGDFNVIIRKSVNEYYSRASKKTVFKFEEMLNTF